MLYLCLHELFEEKVKECSTSNAVVCEESSLTYDELDSCANYFAQILVSRGVRPGDTVGVFSQRSPEFVVAILAVLKVSAITVPLDPIMPDDRLSVVIRDAKIKILVTERSLVNKLSVGVDKIVVDSKNKSFLLKNSRPSNLHCSSESPAYILYTSGSTGRPNGVCVSHKSVVNLLNEIDSRQPISVGDRCSIWTSIGFDVSVYEVFSAILFGAELHFSPEQVRLSDREFIKWLSEKRITSAYIPPFAVNTLSDFVEKYGDILSLRRLLVGVEPIKLSLLKEINKRVCNLKIINGYGPTEATICASLYNVIVDKNDEETHYAPIGKAIQNTSIYLLDKDLKLVDHGEIGEICISGDGLAQGYWNKPCLSAERFVPNPYSSQAGSRLYHTGDLASYDNDGNLIFHGRVDSQIKIRGYRIEPMDISAHLETYPDIDIAQVLAEKDHKGHQIIVAYIGVIEGSRLSSTELRNYLEMRLPKYMIPSKYFLVDEFPRTSNDKVDIKKLVKLHNLSKLQVATEYVSPSSELEEKIMDIWCEVLQLNGAGTTDNFFDLGGTSLLVRELHNKLEQQLYADISIAKLFECLTVRDLAAYLSQKGNDELLLQERIGRRIKSRQQFRRRNKY